MADKEKVFFHQVDISPAYLNADVQGKMYMQQPPNFKNKRSPNKVLRLHHPLWVEQAGKDWNRKLRMMNFEPRENEPCFYKGTRENKLDLIAPYVDDIISGWLDVVTNQ